LHGNLLINAVMHLSRASFDLESLLSTGAKLHIYSLLRHNTYNIHIVFAYLNSVA